MRERSEGAIEIARDLVPVFVPTKAYEKAWHVLKNHHFAVLEGPPEMGKTAIAWMIALTQIANGWTAIVCDRPSDFFQAHTRDTPQIFVADDAFGRTEYDPAVGREWERNLERILRTIDSKHWLVWTSRKHILERARRSMDLQGGISHFPEPADIAIDAADLSSEERALMLYRHARALNLELAAKKLVKGLAYDIVTASSFTPERMRYFVKEILPNINLTDMDSGTLGLWAIKQQVLELINNPSERARKAYSNLPIAHKWLLVSLLEIERKELDELKLFYEIHCPQDHRQPIEIIYDELLGSFIKVRRDETISKVLGSIDWTHPSYRDVVIDELLTNPEMQSEFLKTMSLPGIKLATSDTGGRTGDRRFPFMKLPESWSILTERCIGVVREGTVQEHRDLLRVLHSAFMQVDGEHKQRMLETINVVLDATRQKWNEMQLPLDRVTLEDYCKLSLLISPLPPLPELGPSWIAAVERFRHELEQPSMHYSLDPYNLQDFLEFARTIKGNEPRYLSQVGFPAENEPDFNKSVQLIRDDLDCVELVDPDQDALAGEIDRLQEFSSYLDELVAVLASLSESVSPVMRKLGGKLSGLGEECFERFPEYPDYGDDDSSAWSSGRSDEIDRIFTDL